jgi:L-ornithine N5-oxygenase
VWHSSELLNRLGELDGAPGRFAVVGAGQSAAEVTAHLHARYPDAEVYGILPRYGYTPADDSPFANRVFDPDAVDDFYNAPPTVQAKFYEYHANTNYSVVDLDLINELYRRAYQESVRGRKRLHVLGLSRIAGVDAGPDGVVLYVEHQMRDRTAELAVDVAVFATGYDPMDPMPVLGEAASVCKLTSSQRLRVGRDYRVETGEGVRAGIYLQGGTEHTHGLSSSLLSNLSVRAWDIVESMAAAP